MAIRYKKQQVTAEAFSTYKKWYGKAVSMGVVTTKQLAEEISHSTTVTRSDIMAVLIELFEAMKTHLQNSQTVSLDEIGSFRVGIKSKVADTADAFTANNIYGYRIIYSPDTKFVASGQVSSKGKRKGTFVKTLLDGATAEELPSTTATTTATE